MKATPWRSLAVILAGTLAAAGCGKDSNEPGGDSNTPPVANFTSSCTDLSCTFTDLSSDSDGHVETYSWTFGDGANASTQNSTHTYAAGGDFSVTLRVTDDSGSATSFAKTITVSPHVNGAPTANFSVICSSLDCTFADLSSDSDGNIVAWDWDFGDGSAHSSSQNPGVHSYVASGLATYSAKLIVTDNDGLTSTKTTEFTVSPAATLQCEDAAHPGEFVSCKLQLLDNAKVTVTLTSRECTAHGNAFQITAPAAAAQTLLTDGCYAPAVGTSWDLNGGAVFAAGTELEAQVISGSTKQQVAPALHVTGSYPTWTLKFDDGEDATPPEPDFNDLVLTVTAHN
ncbi:MAG TPA: PKD domain-containing protein [Gemmatimonadales bacterium]|jgi:PKD repeat protein